MVILVWWLVVALTLQVYLVTIIIENINGKTLWNSLNFNFVTHYIPECPTV
jgi:hypothetical protein